MEAPEAEDTKRSEIGQKLRAKCIFEEFMDEDSNIQENEKIVQDKVKWAKLSLLSASNNLKSLLRSLPLPALKSATASQVLLQLCGAEDVQVLYIAVLLNSGADIEAHSGSYLTPIHLLAASLSYQCCNYLILCGADCNQVEEISGRTPLIAACASDNTGKYPRKQLLTVEAVLSSKTINQVDRNGCSALDYALQSRRILLVKRLLAAGASVTKSLYYRNNIMKTKTLDQQIQNMCRVECIDYMTSDTWLGAQKAFVPKRVLMERLLNYRLREELATTKREHSTNLWSDANDSLHSGTKAAPLQKQSTEDVNLTLAAAAELRQANRRKHREAKYQLRLAKEQNSAGIEREKKQQKFLKKVEKEYHVSFKGLFA